MDFGTKIYTKKKDKDERSFDLNRNFSFIWIIN